MRLWQGVGHGVSDTCRAIGAPSTRVEEFRAATYEAPVAGWIWIWLLDDRSERGATA